MNNRIVKAVFNRKGVIRRLYELSVLRMIANSERNVFNKQNRLLFKQLKFSIIHCEWYSRVKPDKMVSIKSFPFLSRKNVIEHLDELCSDIMERLSYGIRYTGGSTGVPVKVYVSGGYEKDFGIKRWKYYGYKKGEIILACDGTKIDEADVNKGIFWYKKNHEDIPFGSWGISSLYLTESNIASYCNFIKKLRPDYLRGYPSFIYSLVYYADTHGINMGDSIKAVELTSETTFKYQIDTIKRVLDTKVYLQYGHTEACVCAYTFDESFKYRCEPLYGFVEIINEKGEHVREGEVGEVVVTSLYNRAMPLIRYKTGDFAEYGGKDNRYVYLNKILGRTQDYVINRKGEKVLLTALVFGQHFRAMEHIQKWQIEQFGIGEIIIHVVKGFGFTENDEKEIFDLFEQLGNIHASFNYVDHIPLTPRGKSKMLIQHIN